MRILYLTQNFPAVSETYTTTEMNHALSHGAEILVHSAFAPKDRLDRYRVPVVLGDIRSAVDKFKPHVIHAHWLFVAMTGLGFGIPMTVRGHSFEFSPGAVASLAAHPDVRRVFLFPHYAARCAPSDKITPMTACYDVSLHAPTGAVKRRMAYRTSAGLGNKDIDSFIRVAALAAKGGLGCEFALTLSDTDMVAVRRIQALNESLGRPVSMLGAVTNERSAGLMEEALVYLRGHDPAAHPYGMPIGIAEAMGHGCHIVARDCPEARAYIGDAGSFFMNDDEALAAVRRALDADAAGRSSMKSRSLEAARRFEGPRVLAPLLDEWRRIAG